MKRKQSKEPIKASAIYTCVECNKDMTPEEFKAHLQDVHKLTEFKGTKRMVMHLDCSDRYMSTYEGEFSGVRFTLSTVNPRRKDDLMRFEQ